MRSKSDDVLKTEMYYLEEFTFKEELTEVIEKFIISICTVESSNKSAYQQAEVVAKVESNGIINLL